MFVEVLVLLLDCLIDQLLLVECVVLLIVMFEFMYYVEMLYCVIINEVVEFVKMFGGFDGYKYVNGVFDKLVVKLCFVEMQVCCNG